MLSGAGPVILLDDTIILYTLGPRVTRRRKCEIFPVKSADWYGNFRSTVKPHSRLGLQSQTTTRLPYPPKYRTLPLDSTWPNLRSIHTGRVILRIPYSDVGFLVSHTNHNQSRKAHRNGIKRPTSHRKPSLKGVRRYSSVYPYGGPGPYRNGLLLG